jgi:hypothetical protein
VDLTDPALLVALVVGVLSFLLFAKLRTPPPKPLACINCAVPMDLEEEIEDPDNPERRFIPGERRGWFRCPRCRHRVRAWY